MRSRTPDRLCAEAVELARGAAEEAALPGMVGEHVDAVADGDRVVTHLFECKEPGYRGWRWAVTVARASRAKVVTLDESVLLPGPDALLAPEWVPWSERLRPGDMGPGDLLPTESEDLRLEPGFAADETFGDNGGVGVPAVAPGSPDADATGPTAADRADAARAARTAPGAGTEAAASAAETAEARQGPLAELAEAEDADVVAGTPAHQSTAPARGSIAAVAEELGMGRARVLSRYGLHTAADRWEEAYGAKTPMAQAAPAACMSCGFLVPLAGSLRQAFGVCANEFSPADGRVVSLAYGCGGHSEAAVMPKPPRPAPPVIDETVVEPMPLRPDRTGGSVSEGEPAEELGHS
ncbi:DUF3027 domain-containing protein [Streptomyces olivaceiscleroticus]